MLKSEKKSPKTSILIQILSDLMYQMRLKVIDINSGIWQFKFFSTAYLIDSKVPTVVNFKKFFFKRNLFDALLKAYFANINYFYNCEKFRLNFLNLNIEICISKSSYFHTPAFSRFISLWYFLRPKIRQSSI